jgi:hypothetical protein
VITTTILTVLADSATYAVGSGDVEEGLAVAVADGLGEAVLRQLVK